MLDICMGKKNVMITVDEELHKMAKEKLINISNTTEDALKEKLKLREIIINEETTKCEFCGKEDQKATATDLRGLSWLWPDEKWICEECLTSKTKKIFKG